MSGNKRLKYSNEIKFNVGTVIFLIIFVYLLIRIVISLQKESLSIYEVQNSYIDTNISTTALIVREEKIVTADSAGDVNYYVKDGEKVGKNKVIYTIDETGKVADKIKESQGDTISLSDESLDEIRTRILNYENYFNYSNYSEVYNFHYDISNAVMEFANEAYIDQLTSLEDGDSDLYKKVYSAESGIVTYYQDGYEDFNVDNFKASDVNKSGYEKKTLKTGQTINTGDPVYKLVTSENWNLIAPLTSEQAKMLKDKDTLSINIHNSSKNIRCSFELKKVSKQNFAVISLNQQMVNYINDRFVDIVIAMDQNNGLKIPNTSITTKKVYKIPIEMLCKGSNTQDANYLNLKVLDDKGEVTIKQIEPTIYKTDKKYIYVDPNDFSKEDVITNSDNSKTLAIAQADTKKLKGVYCVNQGSADFRYIDIIYQDDEYTIVKDGVNYSISWYDRIVLNQSMVTENQIIK